jgi:integrase
MNLDALIAAFQADYLSYPRRTLRTYQVDYRQIFNKFPTTNEPITIELLQATLESVPDNTRQRKRAANALKKLGQFAGLDVDFKRQAGTYSHTKTQARILPSDEAIAQFFPTIRNDYWRWVYGAIAVYGLRPHEAFYLRINPDGTANVLDGKTGPRKIWPYLPEWFYEFSIQSKRLPPISFEVQTFEQVGRQTLKYLRGQANCPWKIYDLRHAWAVRVMDLGLKDNLAARQMGHSVKVHQEIYQHWISDREHTAAFQEILKNRSKRR